MHKCVHTHSMGKLYAQIAYPGPIARAKSWGGGDLGGENKIRGTNGM